MKNDYIIRKTYLSFVIASILTSITATAGMLIDNVIVGHYLGSDALGAMGIVGPISLILSAIGNLCSGGGATRAAQAIGCGERDKVNVIFSTNVVFVLAVGALITVAGLLFTPEIAALLGAEGVLSQPSQQYLYGYFLGTIPTILLSAMMSFVRIDGSPKLPLMAIIVMTVANILLDLLMVLVFHQGMFGLALATAISYCLAVAMALLHFTRKESTLRLVRPKGFFRELAATAGTGMPTAVSRISETLKGMVLNNLMVAFVSVGAVTALSVRTQANSLLGAVGIGIAQAAIPTIGMFFGEEDRTAVKDTLKTTLRFGLIINGILAVVFFLASSVFPTLFGVTDPEIMAMTDAAMRLFAVGMPFYSVNTVLINFYQCTKRVRLATLLCIFQAFVFTVTLSFALIRPMGAGGVWFSFLLGEILTLLTAAIVIMRKNRRFSLSLSAVMMLAEDFGGDPKDRLEISIGNSMEEVMAISAGIGKFAESRAIDAKLLNHISLCIEEMAGNVVKHSFKPGEKRWLDLTLLDKPDSVTVRLRDNGVAFDPLAYASAQWNREHLGIHMIHSLASSFEYKRAMGLNNLVIGFRKGKM